MLNSLGSQLLRFEVFLLYITANLKFCGFELLIWTKIALSNPQMSILMT